MPLLTVSQSRSGALVSKTFPVVANDNDYIEVVVAADNTNSSLNADAAIGSIPAIPSISVTIYQNSQ